MSTHCFQLDILGINLGEYDTYKSLCMNCWANTYDAEFAHLKKDSDDFEYRTQLYDLFGQFAHITDQLRQSDIENYNLGQDALCLPRVITEKAVESLYWQTPPVFYQCDCCENWLLPREIKKQADWFKLDQCAMPPPHGQSEQPLQFGPSGSGGADCCPSLRLERL